MIEEQPTNPIEPQALVARTQELMKDGYRLVQIGGTLLGENLELNYSFDKDYRFLNLRVTVPLDGAEVPSISGVYWSAFLYENEMHDLFGLKVTGMAIDYHGTFYKTAVPFPFRGTVVKKTESA